MSIQSVTPVKMDSTPITIFFFFMEVIQLLVAGTNTALCNQIHLTMIARYSQLRGVTVQEMCIILAITIQIRHDMRNIMKYYWSNLKQFYMPFYSNIMKSDHFFHVWRFLHFSHSIYKPDQLHTQ